MTRWRQCFTLEDGRCAGQGQGGADESRRQGRLGLDGLRLGQPALPHCPLDLRLRPLFRLAGRGRCRQRPGDMGLCDCGGIGADGVLGAGAGIGRRRARTAQALDPGVLAALYRGRRRAVARRARHGGPAAGPRVSGAGADRRGTHPGVRQLAAAGSRPARGTGPHIGLRLGVRLLGRPGGARHRARPDDAGAGLRKDDTRHRADPGPRPGRRARARARPGRSRCSGMSSSWCPSSSGRRM